MTAAAPEPTRADVAAAVAILRLPEPEPMTEHPIWCQRRDCAPRGEHRSRSMTATPSGTDGVTLRLALAQTIHPAAGVRIMLGIDGQIVELSVGQARTLGWLLRRIVGMIGGRS